MTTSTHIAQSSIRGKFAVSGLRLLALSLAVIAGVSHAQQAPTHQGNTVAIELHDQAPTVTNQSILAANASRASKPGNGTINPATTRIVLYVGGNERPFKGEYCTANPVLKTVHNIGAGDVLVASALCKGNRELSVFNIGVAQTKLDPSDLPQTLKLVKSDLVYARQENQFSRSIEGGM
ncbi:hypothetical protein ACFFJT_07025 [Dyella flava]|uniref:Uncharacterized protein n=1 Tax=Dyella flava TaxID=1920170 RepID=A0ABS2K7Z9_9GAMM|nr:hypothetical protein [Dyella flava]MBM7127341.1 hypothetical protein [Dyella flava]GLQ50938.1 hypothetical protein GCM10010872_23870 [Dyella flava]